MPPATNVVVASFGGTICLGGRKILYAIGAVLLVAALARAGFLYWDWNSNKQRSEAVLDMAQKLAAAEILSKYYSNFELARKTAASLEFEKGFATRDRVAVAKALRAVMKTATATVIVQDSPNILYSSDRPDKEDLVLDWLDVPLIEKTVAFKFPPGPNNPFPCGLCALSRSNMFGLSSFVPLREKGKAIAALAISTPFGADFLKGIEAKLKTLQTSENKLGVALYLMQGTRIMASSSELQKSKPPYLTALTRVTTDPFENKSTLTLADGRLWRNLPMWGPDGQHAMGQVIVCVALVKPQLFDRPVIIAVVLGFVLLLLPLVLNSSTVKQ